LAFFQTFIAVLSISPCVSQKTKHKLVVEGFVKPKQHKRMCVYLQVCVGEAVQKNLRRALLIT
jgi:hypothetical protein